MTPTISQYAQALEELTFGAPSAKVAAMTKNFLALLKRKSAMKKLDAIMDRLETMERERSGRIVVTAVTAHEVAKDAKEKLEAKASKLFAGKKVEFKYEIDKDVIGGALFRTDETLYDATLSTELKELKKTLGR